MPSSRVKHTITRKFLLPYDVVRTSSSSDASAEYSNNMITSYAAQRGENKGPDNLVTIESFKDWRDAEDIEELFRFGRIANAAERQLLADENARKVLSPEVASPKPYL
jgi:hypothetical protein